VAVTHGSHVSSNRAILRVKQIKRIAFAACIF
jgi:hypothetical protein